ncbi:MAG TPA: hypothetical protein VN687_06760 [Blastocatellia bacterium]|nr:hypothetical protein [Blastocatellia bacterium]
MAKRGSKKKGTPLLEGKLLCGNLWQLIEVYDSYVKRRSKISEATVRRTFVFKVDGSFREDQLGTGRYEGNWLLTEGKREITLEYTKGRQGRIALRISELTGQRLKIVWPGRCGIFIETYKPKPEKLLKSKPPSNKV